MNMGRKGIELKRSISIFMLSLIAIMMITSGCLYLFEDDDDNDHDHPRLVESAPVIKIVEGHLNDKGMIDMVYLYVDLYGNRGVNMMDVIIHLIATPKGGANVSQDLIFDPTATNPGATVFTVDEIIDPNGQWDPLGTPASYVLGERARLLLNINLTLSATALPPDSELQIFIQVTSSGKLSYDYCRTPEIYPSEGVVILED
jgi:hypothetical protein